MAVKTQWMEQYFLSVRDNIDLSEITAGSVTETTVNNSGTLNTTEGDKHFTDVAGVFGIAGPSNSKVFGVPVKNFPNFDPGQDIITTRKAIGSPVKTGGTGYEMLRGGTSPSTSYEFDADTHTLTPVLWTTFHSGASETGVATGGAGAADVSQKIFTPKRRSSATADPAATQAYATLYKRMSYNSADGHLISDAVVTSLGLSASEGEPLNCSAEYTGRFLNSSFDHDNLATTFVETYPESQPLMWHDAKVTLEDDSDGTHYLVPSTGFNLTVSPQILVKRYNNRFPARYVINGWDITGQITIPWGGFGSSVGNVDKNYLLNRLVEDDSPTQINIVPIELYVFWVVDTDWDWEIGDNISVAKKGYIEDFASGTSSFGETATVTHADGDFGIFMGISPTNVSVSGDDETMITLDFECVDIRSGNTVTQNALEIQSLDALHYGGMTQTNPDVSANADLTDLTDVGTNA